MVSITEILELVMQIVVSLLIGMGLSIPLVLIFFWIKKKMIMKKGKIELYDPSSDFNKMKGGEDENKKFIREKSSYPIATRKYLTKYSESKFFGSATTGSGEDRDGGRRTESSIIKRELSSSPPSDVSRTKPNSKRNWSSFE
jgi:hypothetical protein